MSFLCGRPPCLCRFINKSALHATGCMPGVVFDDEFKTLTIVVTYYIEQVTARVTQLSDSIRSDWILPVCITITVLVITVLLTVAIVMVCTIHVF